MARKCPLCGSRKYRKNAEGQVVCQEGHVVQGVREENLVAEPTGHAMQKRRITVGPRINKRKAYGTANKDLYSGSEAEYLRLQTLQLLLRCQVDALKKLWNLPDALEVVVRELWSYQLLLGYKPNMEDIEVTQHPQKLKKTSPPPAMEGNGDAGSDNGGSGNDDGDNDDVSDEASDGGMSDQTDIDADLLAQISGSSDEDDDPTRSGKHDSSFINDAIAGSAKRHLAVTDTLVCLVLGLWLMRVPFTYGEIESLVNTNQIPYIEFGRSTLVPRDMAKHFGNEVTSSVCPRRAPSAMPLYKASRKFARTLTLTYGLVFPEANVPPLAWKVLSQLGATAVTHAQTMKLLYLLDVNMTLADTETNKFLDPRTGRPYVRPARYDLHMPELSIVAAWVIVMKLAYGLDGIERLAVLKTDPIVGQPKGDAWVAELEKRVKSGALKGTRTDLERINFQNLEGPDIDSFLDRAESVLLKDQNHGTGPHLAQFPLYRVPRTITDPNSWADFHAAAVHEPVRPTPASSSSGPGAGSPRELPLRPGDKYHQWHAGDVTGEVPSDFEVVVQAAADVIGVSTEQVASLVERFEGRMHRAQPKRGPGVQPRERPASPAAVRRVRASGLRESRSMSALSDMVD